MNVELYNLSQGCFFLDSIWQELTEQPDKTVVDLPSNDEIAGFAQALDKHLYV